MKRDAKKQRIKWAAEVSHVREVSLVGTADLGYWQERLRPLNLVPAERDGRAQVLVVAADQKFMGIRFRELSFSVQLGAGGNSARRDAAYLVGAFTTNRVFAWMERAFFSTPYVHGVVDVSLSAPPSFSLAGRGRLAFRAAMDADPRAHARTPLRSEVEGWEGPVYLPRPQGATHTEGKVFYARLRGFTLAYAFEPARDAILIQPTPATSFLEALVDSHFAATEWAIREDALHAKSKTYTESEMLARLPVAASGGSPA